MANAITQWINSKSDQSNVSTNAELLKNSKMMEKDLTQILFAIVPMVEALNEAQYEASGKINDTLRNYGFALEFLAHKTVNAIDNLNDEMRDKDDQLISILTNEADATGALVTAEPTTETKPLMIARESLNELADIVVPEQEKTTTALTTIGDNIQSIQNQTYEIVKTERDAKIDNLVKATEKPKELAAPKKKRKVVLTSLDSLMA